jgi:putative nucleotidyltransferase with HDIG domain
MKQGSPKILVVFPIILTIATAIIMGLILLVSNFYSVGGFFLVFAVILGALVSVALNLSILTMIDPILAESIAKNHRLVRFESLSHPLMLRMSYEAPGTFHHVINVSILAQKAAKTIGADALLTRVAAYYHDLGKLEDPTLYIENQSGEEIPKEYDADNIKSQAKRIIAHVKNGVVLGEENHLPEEIIKIITEHHGTTSVLFFYEMAKERKLKVKRTDFKYEGPIPSSKESAILMLSDSVEAATRSVPYLTEELFREIVESTFLDKTKDRQLKHSGLSDHEIKLIKESLLETLNSIYHQRILRI